MHSDGYIKLDRNFKRSWIWTGRQPFCRRCAFVDLLFRAAFTGHRVEFCDRIVELERGQLITSGPVLAKNWRWSQRKVRSWLDKWQANGSIRMIRRDYAGTLIEVCNYDYYQFPVKQSGRNRITSGEPPDSLGIASGYRDKEGNKFKQENKNRCGYKHPSDQGCRLLIFRESDLYCPWHNHNAVGARGAERFQASNRQLFDKWLPRFLDDPDNIDHPWRKVEPDEIWRRSQGGRLSK